MRFIVGKSVRESANLMNWGFGFSRAEIDDNVQVSAQAPSGFDVTYGDGGGGVYTGRNLSYTSVPTPTGPNAVPFGGTITGYSEAGGQIRLSFEISAQDFFQVSGTHNDADNRALWLEELRGRDVFKLGAGDDRFELRGGNDLGRGRGGDDRIWGGGGQDKLFGDAGDDLLYGGGGADRLVGGGGHDKLRGDAGGDRLEGGAGRDRLWGGKGNDTLEAGAGTDRLWGGAGGDLFLFEGRKAGKNFVQDFGGRDRIAIEARGVDEASDLSIVTRKGDVKIRYGDTLIVLEDAAKAFDAAEDLLFG